MNEHAQFSTDEIVSRPALHYLPSAHDAHIMWACTDPVDGSGLLRPSERSTGFVALNTDVNEAVASALSRLLAV